MRAAASEASTAPTAPLHGCLGSLRALSPLCTLASCCASAYSGFIALLTGWLGPATPRRYALATSQQHISVVEPPRGGDAGVGRHREGTGFASRRSTAKGGSFAELERTRVLHAILHRVQHASRHCADGALSALQGSDGTTLHECTVGPLTVARCGRRAAS